MSEAERSVRVLFTLQPAESHLAPMLGLSAALRGAGHEVVFATSPIFVDRVEQRGERALGVGIGWLESDGPVQPADPAMAPSADRPLFERLFLGDVAYAMATDLLGLMDEFRPDVLVRESVEFSGAAVAEREGVPFATFDLTFPIDHHVMITTRDIDDDTHLEALRRHVGLGPTPDRDWFRGDLQISTFPDSYREDPEPTRPPDVVIRPPVADTDSGVVPPWVEELTGAVYVSFGTVFTRYFPQTLEAAASGAASTGRPTVVTYGGSVDREQLDLPDEEHVRISQFVPQGPVLDRCEAAVIHGGTGSTLGALARGVPLVTIPLGGDQFGHARRVEERGAGVALSHEDLRPDAVADGVRTVTDDPSYRRSAAALGAKFTSLPSPDHAVTALEDLVS